MSTGDRLKGEWSLRLARCLLDDNAITRVIEPRSRTCATKRWRLEEGCGRSSSPARAYWGLWKAILFCAAVEAVSVARPTLDGILFRVMVGLPIITSLLMALVVSGTFDRPPREGLLLLLLATMPQACVVALPLAYFFAVVLDRQSSPPLRVLPAIVGASTACAIIALVETFLSCRPPTRPIDRQSSSSSAAPDAPDKPRARAGRADVDRPHATGPQRRIEWRGRSTPSLQRAGGFGLAAGARDRRLWRRRPENEGRHRPLQRVLDPDVLRRGVAFRGGLGVDAAVSRRPRAGRRRLRSRRSVDDMGSLEDLRRFTQRTSIWRPQPPLRT